MRGELARAISRELSKGEWYSHLSWLMKSLMTRTIILVSVWSSAKAELDRGSAYMSQGSLEVELDPLARAKKEYLEVLKKNYSIWPQSAPAPTLSFVLQPMKSLITALVILLLALINSGANGTNHLYILFIMKAFCMSSYMLLTSICSSWLIYSTCNHYVCFSTICI